MTNLSKTPIGISIFLFAASIGSLCGPPKNTSTGHMNPKYWYCWSLVTAEGQPAILYSNAIFTGEFDRNVVEDGYNAFIRKSIDTGGSGAAVCTSDPLMERAQATLHVAVISFEKKYQGQPHEVRNTQWMYRLGDEKETK
jgi:hypothetical protein